MATQSMQKTKTVSVVMVSWNSLSYLKRSLPTIRALEHERIEIIVVDVGSTDGSIAFLESQQDVRLLQVPPDKYRSKNFACNYGIEKAKGNYILLVDPDILIHDTLLIHKLIQFRETQEAFGCASLAFMNEGEMSTAGYGGFVGWFFAKSVRPLSAEKIKQLHGQRIGYPQGLGIFIEKSVWQEVGGYDETLPFGGDDNDLGMKLWLWGYRNYLYAETLQTHIGMAERKDNQKYAQKWEDMFVAHMYTIMKNYSFFHMIRGLVLYVLFGFIKSCKQALERRHLQTGIAWIRGIVRCVKLSPQVFHKRAFVQRHRKEHRDIFFDIQPPHVT